MMMRMEDDSVSTDDDEGTLSSASSNTSRKASRTVATKSALVERMRRLLADEKTHDVTFTVKGQQFGAHVNVMGAASDIFHAMFYGEFERPTVVDVEDGTPEGFRVLLTYIYTDEATLAEDNVESVLYLAQKYLLRGLYEEAIEYIGNLINGTNILQYLEIAKFFDGLEDNRNEPVTPEAIRGTLGSMFYLIRFPAMDVIEFTSYPLKSGILDKDANLALLEWFADGKEPAQFITKKRFHTAACELLEEGMAEPAHEPVVIRPTTAELEQKYMLIEYDCVEDQYKRNGANVEGSGFLTFAHTAKNMYRKEEHDWQMTYLSREPGTDRGEISWRIEIPPEHEGRVAGATIALGQLSTFKSGKILATVRYADTCAVIPHDSGVYNIVGPLRSMPFVEVSVNFWGGQRDKRWGNVAWQHAQLFRTSMHEAKTNMSLRVNFI